MIIKIWNIKLKGIPGAIYSAFLIFIDKAFNYVFYQLNRGNFQFIGAGTRFYRNLTYRYPKNIQIGKNSIINKGVSFCSEFENSFLEIGDNVSIGMHVQFDFSGNLKVSDNVTISAEVSIFTHDHGVDPRSHPLKKSLIIEENVWIGYKAIVLHNVDKIGKNSIIAAGSVVTKNVEPNTIVGGNPALVIKNFSQDIDYGNKM